MSKKSWILLGALILIIISIGFFYFNNYQSQIERQVIRIEEIMPQPPITETPEIREFNIVAKQFEFIPSIITVNQGDTVRIAATSIDVPHGFLISEFGVNERLEPGETTFIEFVADKKGEFSIACNVVCGSGHSGMKGTLIVK